MFFSFLSLTKSDNAQKRHQYHQKAASEEYQGPSLNENQAERAGSRFRLWAAFICRLNGEAVVADQPVVELDGGLGLEFGSEESNFGFGDFIRQLKSKVAFEVDFVDVVS